MIDLFFHNGFFMIVLEDELLGVRFLLLERRLKLLNSRFVFLGLGLREGELFL